MTGNAQLSNVTFDSSGNTTIPFVDTSASKFYRAEIVP